jgi:hypothetical protein
VVIIAAKITVAVMVAMATMFKTIIIFPTGTKQNVA